MDIGIPRGPVAFMGPQWQGDFVYAVREAKRLGLQIALASGPGWCIPAGGFRAEFVGRSFRPRPERTRFA